MKAEEWRPVAGREGEYEISSFGRVKSLFRIITQKSPWGALVQRRLQEKILKTAPFSNGYTGVSLGKGPRFLVHRLVAAAFIPGDSSLQVNHKDGNRANNCPENLEWVTCSDNHKHAHRKLPRKAHVWINPVIVRDKSGQKTKFESESAAAKHLGVTPGSIGSAVTRGHRCRGCQVIYA